MLPRLPISLCLLLSLASCDSKRGKISATVLLFDLEDAACLGGVKVEAVSSEDVKYQYRLNPDYTARDQDERMVSAIRYDLLKNLQEAILKALEK